MIPHKVQQAIPESIMTTQPQHIQQPPKQLRSMGPVRKLESISSAITLEEHTKFGELYMYFP